MPIKKAISSAGFIMIMTLIFMFVFSLVILTQIDQVTGEMQQEKAQIIYNKMRNRTEMGVKNYEHKMMGEAVDPVQSSLPLILNVQNKVIDACGNLTLDIVALTHWHDQQFKLRSHDIFARVPVQKNCKKMRPLKRLWWKEQDF